MLDIIIISIMCSFLFLFFCVAFGFVCWFGAREEGEEEQNSEQDWYERIIEKNRQRKGPEGSEKIGLPVGEGKKQQERSDHKKGAQTIVFRENAQRIRCPKGSTKWTKNVLTE